MSPARTASVQVWGPLKTSLNVAVVARSTTSVSKPGCWWQTDTSPCSSTSQTVIGSGAVNTNSRTTRRSGNRAGSMRRCIHHISVCGSTSWG